MKPRVLITDKETTEFGDQLCNAIYDFHLSVRKWQVDTKNNVFPNFFESSQDLPIIKAYYIEPGGNFFVAHDEAAKRIIGIVGLVNMGGGYGTLKRLAVDPQYHRQEVGTKLVGTLLEWARDYGFTKITLTTGENEKAKPLYEKFGFQVTGRVERNGDYKMETTLLS